MDEIFNLFDQYPAIPIGGGAALLAAALLKRLGRKKKYPIRKKAKTFLDTPLFHWSPRDPFPIRDLLCSVVIFGAAGSGKTSGSGYQIAKALARNPKIGGMICASKPEEPDFWRKIFHQAGRLKDLIIFNPQMPWRFNFLDFIHSNGGDTRDITEAIMVIGETLEQGKAREDEPFWRQQYQRMIFNATEVVLLATGKVTAPALQQFINGAAQTADQTRDQNWLQGFHNRCLKAASDNARTAIEKHDYALAMEYWLREYPVMADKTRSSILAGVMGILHVFNTGIVRELVSTTTNVSPVVTDRGMWILVDMPISSYGAAGAFILGGFKYLTQRYILHRHANENTCPCVIWADEAQKVVNSFDSAYLAECRSHRGCCVYLTQSIHSFYSRIQGRAGQSETDALLTNFFHKIFHAVGDDKTAQYASSLVGRRIRTHFGGSMSPAESAYDELFGVPKFSGSWTEHVENILENREFMQEMRTGGPENGYIVDGLVVRSGESFSTGEAFLRVAFSQR